MCLCTGTRPSDVWLICMSRCARLHHMFSNPVSDVCQAIFAMLGLIARYLHLCSTEHCCRKLTRTFHHALPRMTTFSRAGQSRKQAQKIVKDSIAQHSIAQHITAWKAAGRHDAAFIRHLKAAAPSGKALHELYLCVFGSKICSMAAVLLCQLRANDSR